MSYRENHPCPPIWTHEQSSLIRSPEPYDRAGAGSLYELDTPDGETTLLMSVTGDEFEQEGWPEFFTFYGVEAPRGCEIRRAFEWDEMSWRDFWTHKGWLFYLRMPFEAGPMNSTYVTTTNLSHHFCHWLDRLGQRSPYDLKLQQLELSCKPSPFRTPKDIAKAEREYQQFMIRHGHKFVKRAA